MDFIMYVTRGSSAIELSAGSAEEAVQAAHAQEAAAGHVDSRVHDISYRAPEDGNFRAMTDEELEQVPGTTSYQRRKGENA